jgi:hypothetical protein
MYKSDATRMVAAVLMFPFLLVCKVLVVCVRLVGALLRFLVGVVLSCLELLKVIPSM